MKPHKQSQNSVGFIGGIVLVAGIILIGFNYWHAMKCVQSKGLGDMDDYIRALEGRIAEVELQTSRNSILAETIISEMQSRLTPLETADLSALMERSKDEAVQIVLSQAALPAPPVSQYIVEDKYGQTGSNREGSGNLYDDLFDPDMLKEGQQYFDIAAKEGLEYGPLDLEEIERGEEAGGLGAFGPPRDDFRMDDPIDSKLGSPGLETESEMMNGAPTVLSKDQELLCRNWLTEYGVIPGVSWGSLPKPLQKKWKNNNCDQVKH